MFHQSTTHMCRQVCVPVGMSSFEDDDDDSEGGGDFGNDSTAVNTGPVARNHAITPNHILVAAVGMASCLINQDRRLRSSRAMWMHAWMYKS